MADTTTAPSVYCRERERETDVLLINDMLMNKILEDIILDSGELAWTERLID